MIICIKILGDKLKMKIWMWTLLSAILFTINTLYYYWRNPEDTVGIIIFSLAAILFYIATFGNWKSGN
jgi:hypothetical protein